MDDAIDNSATADGRAVPTHLWIVGVLALIWNAFGAYDYLMTRMHNTDYLRSMMPGVDPAVALAYVDSMGMVAAIGWGLGVWGALAATLLLLARSRHAVTLYLLSLLGMVMSFGTQFLGPQKPPPGMDNPIIPAVITLVGIGLFLYARAMRQRGVLR